MTLVLCCTGILILCGCVRAWRHLPWRVLCGYSIVVLAWFAVPLTTRLQVPTDIAYQWLPWSETAPDEVPRNPLLTDIPLQMLPFHSLVRQSLLSGALPFWAHSLGTGQPLLGNAQSAPLAPLHLLALPLPPLRGLTAAVVWQTLLSLLLMHVLLDALGCSGLAAAFGALAYAFSQYSVCWAYHPMGMAMAWLPGVLASLVLLRRGDAGGLSGLVACLLGLLTAGHPEATALGGIAAAAWSAALLWRWRGAGSRRGHGGDGSRESFGSPRRDGSRSRPSDLGQAAGRGATRRVFIAKAAGGTVLAGLLAAPAILPVLDAIPGSTRRAMVERRPDLVQPPPFAPASFAVELDPLRLGSPRDGSWIGPAITNFNELCSGYAGLLALGVALTGAVTLPRRIAPLAAAALAALCVAWRLPPLFGLARLLPAVGNTPLARFRLLYVLAVAIAAGLAVDPLLATARRRAALAAVLAALVLGVLLLPPPAPLAPWALAWLWAAGGGAGAVIVCLLLPAARRAAPAVLAGALLAELAVLGVRYQPAVPRALDLAPPAALRYLQQETAAAAGAAGAGPFRTLGMLDALHPNLGALYGLWDPRGNDPMQPAHAALLAGRAMRPHFQVGRDPYLASAGFRQPLLDLLGVSYVLSGHRQRMPPPWDLAWEGEGGRVWRNPEALPLFFVPRRVLASADPAGDLLAGAYPADTVLLPQRQASRLSRQQPTGRVRAVPIASGFQLDIARGGASASGAGGASREAGAAVLVASSVSYAPGWRVVETADDPAAAAQGAASSAAARQAPPAFAAGHPTNGEPAGATAPARPQVVEVDGGFVGVIAGPRDRHLRLVYEPPHWRPALALCGLGLAAAAALAVRRRVAMPRPLHSNVRY